MAKTFSLFSSISQLTHALYIRIIGMKLAGPNGLNSWLHQISIGFESFSLSGCSWNHFTLTIATSLYVSLIKNICVKSTLLFQHTGY